MISFEDGVISHIVYKEDSLKPLPIKVTQALDNKLQKLDNKYRRDVRDWLGSTMKKPFKPSKLAFESSKTLEELTADETLNLFETWGVSVAELNLSYQAKLEELRELVPINQSVTLFGVDTRPPSTFEQKKWLAYAAIFREPSRVFDLMNSGMLSGLEVEALSIFFPSILETMQGALVEGIAELRGKEVGVDALGLDKLKIIHKVLQVPRLSPAKLEQLQRNFNPEDQEPSDVDIESKSTQTDTQRILFK